jgi:hypothetical protein
VNSEYRSVRAELPAQVVELVDAFRNPITQIEFLYLLANAKILKPVLVDAETAARMVRPYSWFARPSSRRQQDGQPTPLRKT